MNLTEHTENRFTKEKDKIEKYLMRIIQRYFDTEQEHSRNDAEKMVIESLTRIKQYLLNPTDFIFNINGESGHVCLTISKLSGEPAFDKNTAFNKDFGIEADTVCEGNDLRLYDERVPLGHIHQIKDVDGLQEILDTLKVIPSVDIHDNLNVLDMIKYSGARTQIDLLLLEYIETAVNRYYENLEYLQLEAASVHSTKGESLISIKETVVECMKRAESIARYTASWLNEANEYASKQTEEARIWYKSLIRKFVTKEQLKKLNGYYSSFERFIADGEIPLQNGTVTLTQIEDTGVSISGDSLKAIYEDGIRLGKDDWSWDDTNKSFVYGSNEDSSYPLFLSLSKHQNYTHRVTLASKSSDDDMVSVILAYDEATGNHLSLICTPANDNKLPRASVVYNYMKPEYGSGYKLKPVASSLEYILSDTTRNWSGLKIPILIKRIKNKFQIWILYNQQHNWNVVTQDGRNDIYPVDIPNIEFNLDDYNNLSCFIDKECKYGYGCFSQTGSMFLDVFFAAHVVHKEPYGQTMVDQKTNTSRTVSASDIDTGRVKMWFLHDNNGITERHQLPFMSMNEDGSCIVVQGSYDDSGHINVKADLMLPIDGLVTNANFYDARTIISPIAAFDLNYTGASDMAHNNGGCLCLIDSQAKNNFVKNLLKPDSEYWIQGYNFDDPETLILFDDNENQLTFADWDAGEPQAYIYCISAYMNQNKKWATAHPNDLKGYVGEYKIKYLKDYFVNPRVYYQVYGRKEVL